MTWTLFEEKPYSPIMNRAIRCVSEKICLFVDIDTDGYMSNIEQTAEQILIGLAEILDFELPD